MANPFSSYQYRDPEKLSIESLGKAAMIKDERYDANFRQTQALVDQYTNSELLKPIDQQYLGDRLKTLVNYVNQSGTLSWDNANVASQVQAYVSGAIDKNVTNAMKSSQALRNQEAKIDKFRNTDKYSLQNEWFAKSDLDRYLKSETVGDVYHAQEYVPYTDVNKKILENSKVLEQFGVEMYRETDDPQGKALFREIRTHKRIDPAKAQQYLNSILDTQDLNQLFIDGQYQYKEVQTEEQAKTLYDDKLNQYRNFNNKKIDYYKTLAVGGTKQAKAEAEEQIGLYEAKNRDIAKTQGTRKSKASMLDYIHKNEFFDKWTGMLSYDHITDFEIDDSGFQQYKESNRIQESNRDYAFQVGKFQYEVGQDQISNQLDQQKLQIDAYSKGFMQDGQGGWVLDPNNPNNPSGVNALGGSTSNIPKKQGDESNPELLKDARDDFYKNRVNLEGDVANEISAMIQSDDNPALKAEMMGVTNSKHVAYTLINSPSKTQTIFQNLSPQAQTQVNQMRSSAQRMQDINKSLKPIVSDVKAFATAVMSNKSKASLQQRFKESAFGMMIDNNGNVVQGDILKDTKGMSPYLSRLVAGFNYRMRSENLDNEDYLAMRTALINELRTQSVVSLTSDQVNNIMNKMVYKKTYNGFWDGLGQGTAATLTNTSFARGLLGAVQTGVQKLSEIVDDDGVKYDFADRFINYGDQAYSSGNREGVWGRADRWGADILRANEDLNSIGISDIDTEKLGFHPQALRERTRQHINGAKEKARSVLGQQFNTSINIGESTKAGKATIEQMKTLFPVETQFSPNSTANVVVDQQKGVASITMGVKDGKEYAPQTIEVPLANMPSSVLNTIKPEPSTRLYSATNPYAVNYQREVEIPDNQEDFEKQVSLMRKDKREDAFNTPAVTKDDIINNLYNAYGDNIVNQNAEKIKQILNQPVTISTIPENGQWTTIATQNGNQIFNRKTGDENYRPDLIDQHSSKLVTEIILDKIQKVLNKNQNGRAIQY